MSTPRKAAALLVALCTANTIFAPPGFAQQAADGDSPPPVEAPVSGTAPAVSDPTDVFVPTEKIGAGSVVAFPVDI